MPALALTLSSILSGFLSHIDTLFVSLFVQCSFRVTDLSTIIISSSMAYNSCSAEASNGQLSCILQKQVNLNDLDWQFRKLIATNNHNDIQHKCNQIVKGGLKHNIIGIKGDVRSCIRSTDKEKRMCRNNIKAAKIRISKKRKAKKLHEIQILEDGKYD